MKQSTNPPAASPPTQPVVYADIQQSTNPPAAPPPTQPVVYTEVKQSINPPAAPPPTQTVVYAEVKKSPDTICSCSQVVSSLSMLHSINQKPLVSYFLCYIQLIKNPFILLVEFCDFT